MRALACPASLKGVLAAPAAAAALAEGMRAGAAEATELPVADGGEGTAEVLRLALGGDWRQADVHDAFGRPRAASWLLLPDGTAVVEAAAAVPLDPERLDPLAASSRGYGELIAAALVERPAGLLLCVGGTATMDAGAGLLEVLRELPVPARVACDVTATLLDAPRLFGPQKGAGPAEIAELERRFAAERSLCLSDTSPVPARPVVSGRRSPSSAPSSCPALRSCSTRPTSIRRATTSSSPERAASTPQLRLAKRPARSCAAPRVRAAPSSAASSRWSFRALRCSPSRAIRRGRRTTSSPSDTT